MRPATRPHMVLPQQVCLPCINALSFANRLSVHTKNLNTAIEVSNALRAGTVWVNTYNTLHHQMPFGGCKSFSMISWIILTHSQTKSQVWDVSWERQHLTTTSRPRPCPSDLVMLSSDKLQDEIGSTKNLYTCYHCMKNDHAMNCFPCRYVTVNVLYE